MPNNLARDVYDKLINILNTDFTFRRSANVILDEKSHDKQNKVIIKAHQTLTLTFSLDNKNYTNKDKQCFPYFKDIKNLKKVSDFIFIFPRENTLFIFVIELKSGGTNGAMEQLRAGYLYTQFIINTALRMLSKNPENLQIEYRGLIFSTKTFNQPTKPGSRYIEDNLFTPLKYQHLAYTKEALVLEDILN